MAGDGLYKEDAERLAQQIVDENPMIDILEIKVDSEGGGYEIVAYDRGADEEFTVGRYETWLERSSQVGPKVHPQLVIKARKRRGKKTAIVQGEWVEVAPESWPDHIREAIEETEVPGESLLDIEPSISDADLVEPGQGVPGDYGFDGSYLSLAGAGGSRVWKQIMKIANFTLTSQSGLVSEWRALGFDISVEPLAPMVEPGHDEWSEPDVLEEVHDRLLDISEQGYAAILVDGQTNATSYAWVLACRMGLKVIISWTREPETADSKSPGLGYTELLDYRRVEESL